MAGVRQVRRLVVPAALLGTLTAGLLSGVATAGAAEGDTGPLPQPIFTSSFRVTATATARPPVQSGDESDLPSAAVRRNALMAADRAQHRLKVKALVQPKAVVKRAPAKAKPVNAAKHSTSSSGQRRPSTRSAGGTALERGIARIPGYSAHRPAHWVSTSRYGHYGATDLASNNIYINPRVPSSRLDSVLRHEWSHILSVRAYGGSYSAMMSATNRVFGGSGMTGAERAADCMAIQLGASWTNYTSCSSSQWRAAAARLLSGRRL